MLCQNVPHNLTDYFEKTYWPRQLGRSQQTRVLYKLTLARFAEYLEAGGGDATAALAHSDRKTTVRSYLDPGITEAGKDSPASIVARGLAFG